MADMKDRATTTTARARTVPAPASSPKRAPRPRSLSLYKVLLLNDDYTPMEFVVHILEKFFAKSREDAVEVMLHVHRHGVGICGVFTYRGGGNKSGPGH